MKFKTEYLKAVNLFYLLIAFEFFYMASPFAMYFYAVYKPGLSLIADVPIFSSLSVFFLPHLAESFKNPLLGLLPVTGMIIASVGLITFLVCAIQVYASKIRRKGAVTGGMYKYIRHPQYTAFAICAFGMVIVWPRLLNLIMFISLLFVYYLLAKKEERECEEKFGDSYRNYKKKTYMFLPLGIGRRIGEYFSRLPSRRKFVYALSIYLILNLFGFLLAYNLKHWSIDNLHAYYNNNSISISIFDITEQEIKDMVEMALNNPDVNLKLKDAKHAESSFINYLMPAQMYISEIPMNVPVGAECHVNPLELDRNIYKIIYTRPVFVNKGTFEHGKDILFSATTLTPLFEVWIDRKQKKVTKIIDLDYKDIKYTSIPEPIF